MSRFHAEIYFKENCFILKDLSSVGTFIRAKENKKLNIYDAIQIGETFLLIKDIQSSFSKEIYLTIIVISLTFEPKEGKLLFTSANPLLTFGKSPKNNVILGKDP